MEASSRSKQKGRTPFPPPASARTGGGNVRRQHFSTVPAKFCGTTGAVGVPHDPFDSDTSGEPVANRYDGTATIGSQRGRGGKLIPSSRHSKLSANKSRTQDYRRSASSSSTASGGLHRSRGSSKAAPAAAPPRLAGTYGPRPVSGVLPRLTSARPSSHAGGISVLSSHAGEADGAVEKIPAYLLGAGITTTPSTAHGAGSGLEQGQSPSVSARPRSVKASLTLQGRPRHGAGEDRAPRYGLADANATNLPGQMHTTYVVGSAIVNPFLAIPPTVQQSVRGVRAPASATGEPKNARAAPTLTSLPSASPAPARRTAVGATIVANFAAPDLDGASAESDAGGAVSGGGEAGGLSGSNNTPGSADVDVPNMPDFMPEPVQPHSKSAAFAADEDLLFGLNPHAGDAQKRKDLFYLESITNRTAATSATVRAGTGSAMQQLRVLYGTTTDDVVGNQAHATDAMGRLGSRGSTSRLQASATVVPQASGFLAPNGGVDYNGFPMESLGGTLARDVLPELMAAESRSAELAAIRRHIDWDIALPSADSAAAPLLPAITFLDAEANPVIQLSKVHFTFNTATLTMERDVEEDMKDVHRPGAANHQKGGDGGLYTNKRAESASIAAHRLAAAIRTVGESFSQGSTNPSLFRFHGLIGLMKGLAEKVGLARVMEYQVTCQSDNVMLLSAPYVDADVGDLVVHLNPSLLGAVRLTIVGFDCAAVNPASGALAESSNVLTVIIRCVHTPLADGHWLVAASGGATEPALEAAAEASGGANAISFGGGSERFSPTQVLQSSPTPKSPAGMPIFPSVPPSVHTQIPSEQTSLGERVSPTEFNLTLASFRKDREARALSRSGKYNGAAAGMTPPGDIAVNSARGLASARPLGACLPNGLPATAEYHANGNVEAAREASTTYEFPATNPHELRYAESQNSSREFIFAQITRARESAKAEAAALERAQKPVPVPAETSSKTTPEDETWDQQADNTGGEREVVGGEEEDTLEDDGSPTVGTALAVHIALDETAEDKGQKCKHRSRSTSRTGGKTGRTSLGTASCETGETKEIYRDEEKLWCVPTFLSARLLLGSLQSPLSHMRLTAWQDRMTALFEGGDQDLLQSDARNEVKKKAKSELAEHVIASLGGGLNGHGHGSPSSNSFGNSTVGMSANAGRASGGHAGRERRSSAASRRNVSPSYGNNGVSASSTSRQSITLLRRLVLCLLLEENRGSQQLFNDLVGLCTHLSHNALLRTIAVTGGTTEGLQRMAAAALAPTPSAASDATHAGEPSRAMSRKQLSGGAVSLSENDRRNLLLLTDVLETCVTAMISIGCYTEAVNYARQRVHALCLLEGDTTGVVCAAQRDLMEALFFYGDYSSSLQVAEDVLLLAEQLYLPNSTEEVEIKIHIVLAAVYIGKLNRARELVGQLLPLMDESVSAAKDTHGSEKAKSGGAASGARDEAEGRSDHSPITQAEVKLLYVLVRPALERMMPDHPVRCETAAPPHSAVGTGGGGGSVAFLSLSVLKTLEEAVALLSGEGDLAELEKSFSTVMPAAALAAKGNGNDPTARAMAVAAGKQKRTRWNLLCLAAILLMQNGEVSVGMRLLESIVEELALWQHRFVERTHRARLSSQLWVTIVAWKIWSKPTELRELLPMMKRTVHQLTRNRGPFHPLSAVANLLVADMQKSLPRTNALNVAVRSLAALQRCVSPCSNYMFISHIVCCSLSMVSRHWRAGLEHANVALLIAQMNNSMPDVRAAQEAVLLGALLRCPPTVEVKLQPDLLLQQLEERVTSLESIAGTHSEFLALPLLNLSDAHFLFGDCDSALACLQRALRLVDSKGTLTMSHTVLKPECQLNPDTGDLERRRLALNALLRSPTRLLSIAAILFNIGAVLEARGGGAADMADAQDAYLRCLAVLETASLAGSLASVRVYEALAKSFYGTGAYADALNWALQAERAIHAQYRDWPQEVAAIKTLVAVVQERVFEVEGTYVCVAHSQGKGGVNGSGGVELL